MKARRKEIIKCKNQWNWKNIWRKSVKQKGGSFNRSIKINKIGKPLVRITKKKEKRHRLPISGMLSNSAEIKD